MHRPLALVAAAGLASVGLALQAPASAEEVVFVMHRVDSNRVGAVIGEVTARDTPEGLVLQPDLKDLPPGAHGFHFHENPDCRPSQEDGKPVAAGMAGGHYDPENTGKHLGPSGDGHKGDLPVLRVDSEGVANMPVTAKRLEASEVRELALVIHEKGDNYSDSPEPLGGGGDRIACGVAKTPASPSN